MRKRTLLFVLALMAALITVPAYAYGPSLNNPYATESGVPLTVHVDGKYVSTDVDPYISNGRTYLPLRAAAESMGAAVVWDNNTRSATVTKDGTVIRCTVGSTAFTVNGVTKYSDAAPQIVSGRTMLPIRPIAEALGGTLSWDGTTASVTIDTPAADLAAPTLPSDIPSEVRWLVEKYFVPADGNGNGSWQCVVPASQVRYALRYTNNYLFISEMPNGTKNAVMVGYSNMGAPSIGVDSMEVVTTSGKLQLKDTWSPHYWHGAGINSSASMYFLVNYDYDGDNLHLSSCTSKNSISSPGWKDETFTLNADFVPFGKVESEKPVDPDNPFPALAYERYPGDENAPDWMISFSVVEHYHYYAGGGEDYNGKIVADKVYVTKPDDMTATQWETLKEYYKDKEAPIYLWYKDYSKIDYLDNWFYDRCWPEEVYYWIYVDRPDLSDDPTTNFVQEHMNRELWYLYENMLNDNPTGWNPFNPVPNIPRTIAYERYPGDENAPDWMVHHITQVDSSYVYKEVYNTKPADMTSAEWENLKNYWRNKERPGLAEDGQFSNLTYPFFLNWVGHPEFDFVQGYMNPYIYSLYNYMINDLSDGVIDDRNIYGEIRYNGYMSADSNWRTSIIRYM